MSKAVFIHKSDSIYDDTPWEKYDFPKMYLSRVENTVGDWIVYYEPRSADSGRGRMVYFAAAKVQTVIPNPAIEGRYFALIAPGTYLPFNRAVERMLGGKVIEGSLRDSNGSLSTGGYAQSAVRLVSEQEFDTILTHGFMTEPDVLGLDQSAESIEAFAEHPSIFERPIVERLTQRKFRKAAFERQVKIAYGNRCAISGLSLRNGGGRPEVQAAHIRPVADNGPDTVRNGVALSGTVHWMFDRGLISIDDDHSILIAEDRVPADTVERLIVPERRLLLPDNPRALPHPAYLKYHRDEIFKG